MVEFIYTGILTDIRDVGLLNSDHKLVRNRKVLCLTIILGNCPT